MKKSRFVDSKFVKPCDELVKSFKKNLVKTQVHKNAPTELISPHCDLSKQEKIIYWRRVFMRKKAPNLELGRSTLNIK